MKNPKKDSTWDLEVVGLISGLILIACFIAAFINDEISHVFITIAFGMGVIINSVITMLKLNRDKIRQGIFFGIVAVLLLVVFVLRLILIKS